MPKLLEWTGILIGTIVVLSLLTSMLDDKLKHVDIVCQEGC